MKSTPYENLLSKDPIGAFNKIKDDYIRYFAHAYRINNSELNKERIAQLKENDSLYKEPYLEILPEYELVKGLKSIKELAPQFTNSFGSLKMSNSFFAKFIVPGLMNYVPYGHQLGMLTKAFAERKNVVITSGTGSGKTESFLLPLFAEIFKEAQTWPAANYVDGTKWYLGAHEPRQRLGEKRTAAVRALVLYPMNALVEDQMSRLRKSLDNDDVRSYFDSAEGLHGNRIYFGRYTGNTIAKKSYDIIRTYNENGLQDAEEEVESELQEIFERYNNIRAYYNNLPEEQKKDKKDTLYVSTRLENSVRTSEMVTRWDMQVTPPDIMITNTSMLSIMLMRKAEENIWSSTRKWLKEDRSHVFHLVVDELHLYRGTAGSEIACLLKMLLHTLDLSPVIEENGKLIPNPQLRILASSASLGDETATKKYLEEFFGIYNEDGTDAFVIQTGTNYSPERDALKVNYSKFDSFKTDFILLDDDAKLTVANDFANYFGCDSINQFVHRYEKNIFCDVINHLPRNEEDGSLRPISYTALHSGNNALFPTEAALRGFLIFRGFVDTLKDQNGEIIRHHLPRFRFHQFFKYIEGLWGELRSTSESGTPVSNLSYVAEEVGPNNHKVLELLRCECCGELYIGGNRKLNSDKLYMTLNYPDLLKIPNFNPTPMVQNKSVSEYVLFWPHKHLGNGILEFDTDSKHVALLSNGSTAYNATGASCIWKPGFLNVDTGEITTERHTNTIEGYLYDIQPYQNFTPKKDDIQAMPCCCPKCGQNYTSRKYAKSPIRSFRTGIDRMNQLLSKGLFYQLSENSKKLIGFSDSRDDAAKQAYGIEKEQYRDMVRFLFIECVKEINRSVDDIVDYVNTKMKVAGNDFSAMYGIVQSTEDAFPDIHEAQNIAADVLQHKDLAKYQTSEISLTNFIGKANDLDGILVKKLVKLGINPAGVSYDKQFFKVGNVLKHWSEAFDFSTGKIRDDIDPNYVLNVKKSLISAVFSNSFGKYMGVSVLDSGIGYICCKRSNEIEESNEYVKLQSLLLPFNIQVYDFIDAYIRVLGDNYRYEDPDFDNISDVNEYSAFKSPLKKIVRKMFGQGTGDEAVFGNALYEFLRRFVSGEATKLNFSHLAFRIARKEDFFLECPNCHRIHLNPGFGFCTNTNCMCKFDETVIKGPVINLWNHYISYDINVEPKLPRRLHTEELTGQTDNIQERLLQFKDLILTDNRNEQYRTGYELTKSIDMVNVTTTMEVGVDIGSLEAIFQGNMSPTRYNYQQRVGRGGRRNQAYSLALTFCRGRSHDVYYYYKGTEEMLGSVPVAPTLSLAPYFDHGEYKMKMAIMKRVIVKIIFKEALGTSAYEYDLVDTSGEFGYAKDWDLHKKAIDDWIKNNAVAIREIVEFYFGQYNKDGVDISKDINELCMWIQNSLLLEIDNIVGKNSDPLKGLAQYMSECGYLPMYGMPSDLRLFYHGFDTTQRQLKSINRPLEMSISDFAPGAEKTKDKGIYYVDGLTLSMKPGYRNAITPLDQDENHDALSNKYIITYDEENNECSTIKNIESLSLDQSTQEVSQNLGTNQHILVIPHAYRSFTIINNSGQTIDNNERTSSFRQCSIYAQDNKNGTNSKKVCNVNISAYGLGLNDESEVWHVNSNNNKFFVGKYVHANNEYEKLQGFDDSNANFMIYQNHQRLCRSSNDAGAIQIAIASRKPTEMVKLELLESNPYLDLSLNSPTSNKSIIRSAFFSAAFLIQRALADKLDVQPEEIEISEKLGGDYPVIYLNDALPNGAGLVSYLYDEDNLNDLLKDIVTFNTGFMQSLLHSDHKDCLTACQKCLKTYSNRGFHHVLDWRLGVGIINLMLDSSYNFGFMHEVFSLEKYPELSDDDRIWKVAAQKLSFDESATRYYCIHEKRGLRRNIVANVIMHPFWNLNVFLSHLQLPYNLQNIRIFNTFKLLRSDMTEDVTLSCNNMQSEVTSVNEPNVKHHTTNYVETRNSDDSTSYGITPGQDL